MSYNFVKYLSNSDYYITWDIRIFKALEAGLMTKEECLEQFMKNNKMENKCEIDMHDFIEWLNSLGYNIRY